MPEKNERLNVGVNGEVKKEATRVLQCLGLSMSDAIGLYLNQIAMKRGIPFEIRTNVSSAQRYIKNHVSYKQQRIDIRVNQKTKEQAERILDRIYLSMSDAITIYLLEIIRSQGIPFAITIEKDN